MPKNQQAPTVSIEVTKKAGCNSLSGRSELCYETGSDTDGNAHIRLTSNTGGGQFNKEWIALSAIQRLINAHPGDKTMTSSVLAPLFRGRSSNSASFLFAAIQNEGLIKATSTPTKKGTK